MSDAVQDASTDPTPPRRRWRRRLLRVALVLLGIALLVRVTLPITAPWVVDRVAAIFDLTCTFDDYELSVFSGQVQVWGVEVAARVAEGEEPPHPYVDVEFAEFDLDVSALFALDLHVRRLEADGVDLFLERTAQGEVPLLRHLPKVESAVEELADGVDIEVGPVDLTLPVRVDAMRAQHVRIHYIDDYVVPPVDSWIESSVRISGLGLEERGARIEIHAYALDLLDSVTIQATARSSGRTAEVAFDVDVRGVNPTAAPGWLRQFDLEPGAERISVTTRGELRITPHPTDELAVVAAVDFEPVSVIVDGEVQARIDDIQVSIPQARRDRVHVALVAVNGVQVSAKRSEDGVFGALGIDVGAAAPARPAPEEVGPAPQESPDYITQIAFTALRLDRLIALDWRFDELRVSDVSLVLRDAKAGQDLELRSSESKVRDVVFGSGAAERPIVVSASVSSPGVFDRATVAGELRLAAGHKRAEVRFEAGGITGDGIDPYLQLLGIATDLDDARAAGRAIVELERSDAGLDARVELVDIEFVDGDRTLAALESLVVSGARIETDPPLGRVEAVELSGGRVPVRRDVDGALHAVGLKTVARPAPAARVGEAVQATAVRDAVPVAPTEPFPRLELGVMRWTDVALAWVDDAVEGSVILDPIAMEGEVADLGFGGPADPAAEHEGRFRAVLRPGSFANELVVEGTVTTRPGPIDARLALEVRGESITWEPFAPYLAALGIVSGLDEGFLRGTLSAAVRVDDGVAAIEASLSGFDLRAGESPLASLAGLDVVGVQVTGDGLRIASIVVDRPVLHFARTANARFDVLGLSFDPFAPPAPGEPEVESELEPEPAAARLAIPVLPRIAIDMLAVRGASIALRDDAAGSPVASDLTVDATLNGLSTVPGDGPATIEATARGEGFLGEARFRGRVELLDESIEAEGEVVATGLRAGPLAGYLPPGVTISLENGRAEFAARARIAHAADGGLAIDAELGRIELRDADDLLAGVESIRLRSPRVDPAAGVFTIAETRVAGAELRVVRTGMAAFRAAGIEVDLEARAAARPVDPVTDQAPDEQAAALSAPGSATRRIPTVVLESLDLELARLRFVDQSGDEPLQGVELRGRLSVPERVVLLDADPEALAPWAFVVDGSLAPLVDSVRAEIRLAPWQSDAELAAVLEVTGIHGDAMREIVPELAALLLGSDIDDGTFGAELETRVRMRRKTAIDIDLARGFGADVELRNVALRGTPDGDVLLGVDAVRVDAKQIHPVAGVHLASIEVENPRGRVLRDAEGLHVAGFVFPDPLAGVLGDETANETAPAEQVEAAPIEPAAEVAVAEPNEPPFAGLPDFRIDQLVVQGADFEVRDVVSDPPFAVPVRGLDVEIARFSTRALDEGRPIKFTAVVQGGEVELPVRYESASLLSGLVESTAALVAGGGDDVETEPRPIFEEAAVHGRISLYPALDGRVRASLASLELTAFRGIARQMGIDIGDGVLDAGSELRFEGELGVHARAELTFGYLVVDEEPGGPISTYLSLPAPLQTVVFVMKDSAGEISVPIDVRVQGAGVTTGQILSAAASAAGTVIATAVAESPLRVVGGVGGLFGIGGGEAEPPSASARIVEFAAADAALRRSARDELRKVIARVADDQELVLELRHQFGAADLERADRLGNPDTSQALALVARLRQQRDDLQRRRAEVAAAARVAFALGRQVAIEDAQRELRVLWRELGETEDALDRMLEFTRPGAERRRDRRTRATAIGIARQRLESVRLVLIELGGAEVAGRIEVRRPSFVVPDGVRSGSVVITPKERKQQ